MIRLRKLRMEAKHFLAAWLLGAVMAVLAVVALIDHAANRLLQSEAEQAALQYAQTMGAAVIGLETLLAERVPSAQGLAQLRQLRRVGDVFRFKLFDRQGLLILVSDDLDVPGFGANGARLGDDLITRSRTVEQLVLGGRNVIELKDGWLVGAPQT